MFLKAIKLIVFIYCSTLIIFPLKATINTPADSAITQNVRIHFRVNRTFIERDYMDNAYALRVIDRILTENPIEDVDFISVTGSASPEGDELNNSRLSELRALALKNHILLNYPQLQADQVYALSAGEDWDGLTTMVENDWNVPYRNELLYILYDEQLSREAQKRQMQALRGGRPYQYLMTHILPYLRGSVSGMIYFKKDNQPRPFEVQNDTNVSVPVDTVYKIYSDTVYLESIVYVPQEVVVFREVEKKPFFMAVKTNMLYDAALLPNLSVEIPFGRGYAWSALVEGNWSWWDTGADKYNYHRIQMGGAEVRRWFGNRTGNPLNGWFVGLYGFGGDYDIRLFADKNSDIGQQSLLSYSGGLTFGYAMPIGRRFNLEFSIGGGYLGGKYKKYKVSNCEEGVFPLLSTHNRTYFGPTKIGVSLVWQIGSGVNNKKERKGAQR
ncbi:DUF3575 domain-containing protein [Parabacteroides sp. PF5-9]|uniref:DUF3575 domain-containing protein n=1 Tax=Parabacteroides sp. PF5-9 TaxID=1742404 RepID=UPI002475ECDE|nr:DUF3575 domain-containing protein [Parabacteroides sp. PF5-9]MDH6357864.1 hypothetical protein [Parabacteroides sp. PF5-9]